MGAEFGDAFGTMAAQTPACTVNPPETKRRLTCSQLRGALSGLPQVPSTGERTGHALLQCL